VSYTAVVYSPNMSATAHVSRIADPRKAWGVICSLLDACENVSGPSDARFTAYKATKWDDAAIAARCVAATVDRFGRPRIETEGGRLFPSGEPQPGGYLEWPVPAERFPEFRDYVLAGHPWPKTTLGPVELRFDYMFQWRDPDGRGPHPAQLSGHPTPDGQQRSCLTVTLSRRMYTSPHLCFPFGPTDPRLFDLLSFVTPLLPFKLTPTHFRHVTLNKRGAPVLRRIVPPLSPALLGR
jgi:hypothetical protein